jgi:hypothetical protein
MISQEMVSNQRVVAPRVEPHNIITSTTYQEICRQVGASYATPKIVPIPSTINYNIKNDDKKQTAKSDD